MEGDMALVDDILAWAVGLPAWQSDALRRLFRNGALSAQDQGEVLALLKEQHGGPAAAVAAIPLSANDVSQAGGTATVRLTKLDQLQNVNRFPAGRELNLAHEGLTAVFGENGAGKSGYARVLKNACRARVRQAVLPDVFVAERPRPIPSADVTFVVDGQEGHNTYTWQQGEPSLDELGNVMVYDSACGTDYLTREGTCEYQPYGLPHLNRLATTQREMQEAIDTERQNIRLNPVAFDGLKGDHPVGHLIAKLGKDTDMEKLRELGTLAPEVAPRMEELTRVLGTMNPEPEAKAAELLAKRLDAGVAPVQQALRFVTDRALDEIKERHDKQQAAQAALEVAQQQLHADQVGDDGLLPGTGNPLWKALFRAAEKFSTTSAYPGHDHPNVDEGAKCVLCQTPLDDDAKGRMDRFARYVVEDASKNAEEASALMTRTMDAVAQANLSPVDLQTLEELRTVDAALHALVEQTTATWSARRAWAQRCVAANDWSEERPALPDGKGLDVLLTEKAEALRKRAQDLRTALDPQAKRTLEQELATLRAREHLNKQLAAVEQFVEDSKTHAHLTECHKALNPQMVSRQMTKLADTYVTDALAEAMNDELTKLGRRRRVEPELIGRTAVGRTMMALKMVDCDEPASQVLSEGEQRAMSLALFLAELRLQDHRSTVVFDDPSTSFDHHHRRRMAARLAELAKERPVVVFTHDAVFLAELGSTVTYTGQQVLFQTVGWGEGQGPGFVSAGLTWETMSTKDRLTQVRDIVATLRGAGDYLDEATKEKIKVAYTKLRGTIERAVREVFLNNTVQPFSDAVSIESFGIVVGFPQGHWEELTRIYDRCCEVTDAHDTNAAHQLPIPDPEELVRDVDAFGVLLGAAQDRRKAYNTGEKQRRMDSRKIAFASKA
jgi:ABC-type Mn2+/Zn2+ transport system ATPase subunit